MKESNKTGDVDPAVQAEAELVVAKIRTTALAKPDINSAAANVLLNLIPVAGGVVAAALGEYSSQRRTEKICDVLASLNQALENHGQDPEKHLTKDQIVEVVYDTLREVATASDKKKIEALKHGLNYTFTSSDSFDDKQLFLSILRGLTSHELALFAAVYRGADPYRIELDEPLPVGLGLGFVGTVGVSGGRWEKDRNVRGGGKPPLIRFLVEQTKIAEPVVLATAKMLDAKGLTFISPNLNMTYQTEYRWMSFDKYGIGHIVASKPVMGGPVIDDTPLEKSKTTLGEKFVGFF